MCRMFGWAAAAPTSAVDLLGPDVARLQVLSELHEDGWGTAWHGPAGLRAVRDDGPAHESSVFVSTLAAASGSTGVVHLRLATGNIPVCLANTHPFVRGEVAFCHNGSVPDGSRLDVLVDPDLLASMSGTNDSERYFLALLSARRRGASVPEAFSEVIDALTDVAYPSLNAMWIEPGKLYVVAEHHAERRPSHTEPDYYDLRYESTGTATAVWSTGVRSATGISLPNHNILIATAATGEVELVGW